MNANLLLQNIVIAVLVGISLLYVIRKLAPFAFVRMQAGVSATLTRNHRGSLMKAIGKRLQPRQASGDCGSGCGTCGSCGTSAAPASDAQTTKPVVFHPKSGSGGCH